MTQRLGQLLAGGSVLAALALAATAAALLDIRPFRYEISSHATAGAMALHALDTTQSRGLAGDRDVITLIGELDQRMRRTAPGGARTWDVAAGVSAWAADFEKPVRARAGVASDKSGKVKVLFPWPEVQRALDLGNPVIATVTVPPMGPPAPGAAAPAGGASESLLAIGHMQGQPRLVVLIPWECPEKVISVLNGSGAFRRDPNDQRLGYLLYEPPVGTLTVTVVERAQ